MPLISIVTIVRNDLAGLKRTATSIANQGFMDFEWWVIDGASTDGTAEFTLSIDHPYAHAISERDKGIYDAMNKGLERARGEFVVFLNAGDTFASPATLADVAAHLESGQVDFLYGDSEEAYGGREIVYKIARGHEHLNYGMFGCHQSMYYRRAIIDSDRYSTSFKVAGDYEFTSRFLKKSPRIRRLPQSLSVFDLTGTSVQNRQQGRQENWRVQRDVLRLSWMRRVSNQLAYLITSFINQYMPEVYKWLRFRKTAS